MKHWIMKFERRRLVRIFRGDQTRVIWTLLCLEIYNRNPNKTSLDANTVWQQVVTSLNEQSSIREALPVGGGFISK